VKSIGVSSGVNVQAKTTTSASGALHILNVQLASWSQWSNTYVAAMGMMKSANGLDYAATPGAATAFTNLLVVNAVAAGMPLPKPTQAADGVLAGCGKEWYDTDTDARGPMCSAIDFCCNGEIDFNTGKTLCTDFMSCRGKPPPPMLLGVSGSTGAGSGSEGEGGPDDASSCGIPAGGCAQAGLVNAMLQPGCCEAPVGPCTSGGSYSSCTDGCGNTWYEYNGQIYGPCAPGDSACLTSQATAVGTACAQ
jgi:hypothetical protein